MRASVQAGAAQMEVPQASTKAQIPGFIKILSSGARRPNKTRILRTWVCC